MSDLQYKTIVGLEIHVQLKTQSKMFCSCPTGFGGEPNTRVCPVCLGMPGVLPVMNKQAYEFSVLAALALNCTVPRFTKWDRKNYYYPDLPKNYQISQYDLPMSENGFIEIPLDNGGTKRVRIRRAHLEEDAGKNSHAAAGNYSQVDLNRTGTPLLEIVTEPDLSNGSEVRALAVELQRIVRYLGVSEADMQKGHMRFEPNVNLVITRNGQEYKTAIAEIKNLNSFKALEKSVDYETTRQLDEFLQTGKVMGQAPKTTRGWDAQREITVFQRSKEEANDYRYFPDPDLVPVVLDDQWFDAIKDQLPELPLQKESRFIEQFGLTPYDAGVLTADRDMAEYFESTIQQGGDPKKICNFLTQTGLKLANEAGCSFIEFGLPAVNLAQLSKMVDQALVSASAATTILEKMIETKQDPDTLAQQLNLIQKSDAGELEALVDQIIAENPKAIEDAKEGKKAAKAKGFLMGQIMKQSGGQANPKIVNEILSRKLGI